jgi:putative PIN family toxin of toxin-antitoxin system
MKLILDTNVLVSGIFFGGIPGCVLAAWSVGGVQLVLSPAILEEYRRVGAELASRHPERATVLGPVLALLVMNAVIVDAPPLTERVSADPADDMFLAAALASRARLIVSGDPHLLDVSGWRGITVLTPRQFVDQHVSARDS